MSNNLLDLTLLFEVGEGLAGQAAVDLQTVDEGSDGDEAVGLDILVELLGGGLVEDDGVLGLVLDCFKSVSLEFSLLSRVMLVPVRVRDSRLCRFALINWFSFLHFGILSTHFVYRYPDIDGKRISTIRISTHTSQIPAGDMTYPCPWTTSSSASCHRRMLLEPVESQID